MQLKYWNLYLPVVAFIWVGLYLDSVALAKTLPYNQLLADLIVLPVFFWVYYKSKRYLRQIMLFGILVAIFGETLFSLLLGMYTYRLENIPLYVFFGHSIVYAGVYYLAKEPTLKIHKELLVKILLITAVFYALFWLIFANDIFGFLCTLGLLLVVKRYKASRLFFLLMFFMVAYLELIGTHYGCWAWPSIWFNSITLISSANPPSGIGFFYFLFDAGCLWIYKHFNKQRWQKLRAVRQSR
jgi:hypothetical protein